MSQEIDININDGGIEKRNPFLSFLLSFVIIGLGQMYNGQLKKGIIYLLLLFPLYLVIGLVGMRYFPGLVAVVIVIVGYKIFVAIEAYKTSKKIGEIIPKKYNHLLGYILYIGFYVVMIYAGVAVNKQLIGYNSYAINTPSMLPNLHEGDRVITMPVEEYLIGEIIAFKLHDGLSYIARIVALPDQRISIGNDEAVYPDGRETITARQIVKEKDFESQIYNSVFPGGREIQLQKIIRVHNMDFPKTPYSDMDMISIPAGHVFVMGDNRNNSMDSRMYGPVPISNITGVVKYVYWSNDLNRVGSGY